MAVTAPTDRAARTYVVSKPRGFRIDWTELLVLAILGVGGIISFLPFFWMVTSAFKLPQEVTAFPPVWIPSRPTMDNIVKVWDQLDFARYFANSLFLSVTPTIIILFTSMLVGYVLAKIYFWGREFLFLCIIATMMVPWPVTLIPSYQMMSWFGWLDTYWPLIVPGMFSSFGIFLVRQFMHSIPDDLLDAGRIDGASELRIFVQLVLPLSVPVISTLGIFNFMWHWDSFLWPMIVLNDQKKFPLTVALRAFTSENIIDYAATMAGAMISVIPVLIVYMFLQKHFVAGVALTGMKG